MQMFIVEVKHDGTRVVATLRVSAEGAHCDLVPGGRPLVRFTRPATEHCLTAPATAAIDTVERVLAGLRDRVGTWGDALCGCAHHSEVEMEPLFDLV